ncbi:MAG: UvrD-helicase domain-containing protein [Planctomycetes bacterium]|nr:UvrD-helicase domain-containing protein [Planctomycetota bacterium]
MSKIEVVSASAGSGKTYHLAGILEEALVTGEARPEGIVATTFTVKAAAELRERVRARLLRADRVPDAQRLGAARIGTVHSVCGKLIRDHAFLLGLSPEQRVLDEVSGEAAFQRALSLVITPEEDAELSGLSFRFHDYDWRKALKKVVSGVRSNEIGPEELESHAQRSIAGLLSLLDAPAPEGEALDRTLLEALESFLTGYDSDHDSTKMTRGAQREIEAAARRLKSGLPLQWWTWAKLTGLKIGAKSKALGEPVWKAAAAHDRHPALRADLTRLIELVFGLAARALDAYQETKRAWGVVDFEDQEALALCLLRREEVRERLREEIDLVLVDEFQDTSPIQLAIFLELAALAKRSVWVGDQKQAIFAFRGTDPALMDAAIESILEGKKPARLGTSYRSRPVLVELTSDLFGQAFEAHGLPRERVHLEPALTEEPAGLGPVIERWCLSSTNVGNDAKALAGAVREFLADPEALVRDRESGVPRAARPGDLAVLCRTNDGCSAVANALEALGVSAELARPGLLASAEGRYVLAALQLWVDPQDSLAAAEVARLVHYADRGAAFLESALADPYGAGFRELPEVAAIEVARERAPRAGAVAALDAVLLASRAHEYSLGWGESSQRLANLEALRALAVTFAASGAGSTPAGLIAQLKELASEGLDTQGKIPSAEAVCVRTWHGAKGLEWAVTILFQLENDRARDALGVAVASEREGFDLAAPMEGRWIRFWPWPYGQQRNANTPMWDRLASQPAQLEALERGRRESLRLLYVGWTRARDRLVLAGRTGKLLAGSLKRLASSAGTPLLSEPGKETTWGQTTLPVVLREGVVTQAQAREPEPGAGYLAAGPADHPAALITPSAAQASGQAGALERLGSRLRLSGNPDMQALGQAVHGFLAADRPEFERELRLAIAERLLARWGVRGSLPAEDLLTASERLGSWVGERWPKARWRRELPVALRREGGSLLRGIADLVLEGAGELVLVDHKSFPGTEAQALERAQGYAGQLAAYAETLGAAIGKPTSACWIHLPLLGLMVPIERRG